MTRTINDISLLPWQSTILTWAGGATIVLLLVLIMMMFFRSKKRDVAEKIHTISFCILVIFIIVGMLSNIAAISFLIDVKLGWKLALLAAASMMLCIFSIVGMLLGAFGVTSSRIFWLWTSLFMLSFVSLMNLVMISLGGQ